MTIYLHTSGTITLGQIRNNWVSNGFAGYYHLRAYSGAQTYRGYDDAFIDMPSTNISLKLFYGVGPISPAPGGDPGGGGGGGK